MKKQIIIFFVVIFLLFVYNSQGMGNEIGIDYGFEINTEEISDSTLVPLEQFREKADLEIYKLADGRFNLELEGREMLIKPGDKEARVNDIKIEMAAEPLEINDDLLISYDALELLFEEYDEEHMTEIKIHSPDVDLDKSGFNVFLDPVEGEIEDDSFLAELILVNNSGRNQNLAFNTSQKYDLSLTDEDGNEVYRWSRDKSFLQAIQHLRLGVRETESWQTAIKIEDLSPGKYKLEGWLTDRRRSHSYSLTLEIEDE